MDIAGFIQDLDNNTKDVLILAGKCSPEQLSFKENDKWSILQIFEHISITDKIIYTIISKPSDNINETPELIGNGKLKRILVDLRERKIQSPEILRPKGTITNIETFEKIFIDQRNLLKEDLLTGKLLADNRIHKHPFLGDMTIPDWLNFLIHHTQRHMEQIKDNLKKYQLKENQQV